MYFRLYLSANPISINVANRNWQTSAKMRVWRIWHCRHKIAVAKVKIPTLNCYIVPFSTACYFRVVRPFNKCVACNVGLNWYLLILCVFVFYSLFSTRHVLQLILICFTCFISRNVNYVCVMHCTLQMKHSVDVDIDSLLMAMDKA